MRLELRDGPFAGKELCGLAPHELSGADMSEKLCIGGSVDGAHQEQHYRLDCVEAEERGLVLVYRHRGACDCPPYQMWDLGGGQLVGVYGAFPSILGDLPIRKEA